MKHKRLAKKYHKLFGRWPNFAFPKTYNEKCQWRKIFDHNPVFVDMVDKIISKDFMTSRCPDLPVAKVLWTGTRAEDIPEDFFRAGYVLKVNHACQRNIFTSEITSANRARTVKALQFYFDTEFGENLGEWAYSEVDRRIFVEELMGNAQDTRVDLNFECFDGEVYFCFVQTDKEGGPFRCAFYDKKGQRITSALRHLKDPDEFLPNDFQLPPRYQEAVGYAQKLSKGFDYIRVDITTQGDAMWASEMTIYSATGFGNAFEDDALYRKISQAWDLKKTWFLTANHSDWRKGYAKALKRHLEV